MNHNSTSGHCSDWLDTLASRRGSTVSIPNNCYLFCFYTADEAAALVRDWHQEIGLKEFHPIGSFCSGDFVCAHPCGTLFVVLHDSMEWWDSAVTFAELIWRLDASDLKVEEDVYGST